MDKQNELIDKSAGIILKSDFFKNDEPKLKFYKKYFPKAWERAVILGRYILEHKATVRAAAKQFGISKSTVHIVVAN